MDFLVRRRSLVIRDLGGMGNGDSPILSRRRSASPLLSPMSGSFTSQFLERNRQAPCFPQTEDEQLYLFHERIIWNQERSLLPLAHDLSDWMNSILSVGLNPSNLMETLETGVVLCQLAKLIEEKAALLGDAKLRPRLIGRVRPNARRGSFFARDNVAIFINFCRDMGIHSNLLFETNDLVSHGEVRSVLICLMEVGRLAVKYGIDPPALVALEQQMEMEAKVEQEQSNLLNHDKSFGSSSSNDESHSHGEESDENKENPPPAQINTEETVENYLSDSVDSGLPERNELVKTTELDLKVNEVARISTKSCCCVEETRRNFKMRKLSEGKYLINGRTVFVRLLKGVHVMVRIGGGWETLEEFLVRNDPCRIRNGSRRRSSFGMYSNSSNNRPASSPPVMVGIGLRPCVSACSTPQRSRHSSRNSLAYT